MTLRKLISLLVTAALLSSCGWDLTAPDNGNGGSDPNGETIFKNATSDNLPGSLTEQSNHAQTIDINDDNALDIIVAVSLGSNKVLINDGNGRFSDETAARLPEDDLTLNSQSVVIADLNSDNNPDLFFTNSQNQASELYVNTGSGNFSDISNRIPVTGNFTVVLSFDIDQSGSTDLVVGNQGQNIVLMNNGNAFFTNQTSERFPQTSDLTRDLTFGDITGNGLNDIIFANEGTNFIFINTGSGFFSNQSGNRIPYINAVEESQSVALADVDGDGDQDIYFGNSSFQVNANPQDRLLINDSQGFFSDQTADRLPEINTNTYDTEFADLDNDGALDLIIGNYDGGIQVLINDGNGNFEDETEKWIPEDFTPEVSDLEVADFNGDERTDIYISVHSGQDQLLLQRETD